MIAADYSSADAKYAATTIVSTTLPPTRDVRALVAHRAPYVSRAAIASVRLLDPIAAFAIGDTSIESKTQRMANVVDMFRFADESSAASSSAVCASVEVEVLVELSELRQQVAHADRKAQLAAWFASSPMDGIGKFGFNFASAVTAASLDALLQLSAPLPEFSNDNDFLHFADICGGPGGFSEYIMHRRQTHGAKGWGITLRNGANDFALDRFCASAHHSNFTTHYGADDSGDVTLQPNIDSFVALVAAQTKAKMLALVLANGAEHSSSAADDRLLLAQLQLALALVRNHGCVMLRLATPHNDAALFAASLLALCSASICVTRAPAAYGEAHMTDTAYLYARNVDETLAREAALHVRRLMEQPLSDGATKERFVCVGDAATIDNELPIYLQSQRRNSAMASVYALRRAIDVLVISRNAGAVAAEYSAAVTGGEVAAARAALKERVAREWNLPRETATTASSTATLVPAVKPSAVVSTTVAAVSTPTLASQRDKHKATSVYNSSWQAQSSTNNSGASNVNLSAYLAPSQVKPGTTASYAKSSAAKRPASEVSTTATTSATTTAAATAATTTATTTPATTGKVIRLKQPTSTLPSLAGVDLSKYKSKLVPEKK